MAHTQLVNKEMLAAQYWYPVARDKENKNISQHQPQISL